MMSKPARTPRPTDSTLPDGGGAGRLPGHDVTLTVRDTCLGLHVRRAARTLARRFDDALRPMGLTGGQFSLLMALNRPSPAVMGEVAELLAMDRTTLTANLKPLARRGLVEVAVAASDRRIRRLSLTPAGRSLLAAALPLWEATQAAIAQRLADPERLRAELRILSDSPAGPA